MAGYAVCMAVGASSANFVCRIVTVYSWLLQTNLSKFRLKINVMSIFCTDRIFIGYRYLGMDYLLPTCGFFLNQLILRTRNPGANFTG